MKNLLFLAWILLLGRCKDYDNTIEAQNIQVPAYTETGANTFGCYVNGKVWINFGKYYHPNELGSGYYEDNLVRATLGKYGQTNDTVFTVSGALTVLQKENTIRDERLSFNILTKGKLPKTYLIGSLSPNGFLYEDWLHGFTQYRSKDKNPLVLIIKKDSVSGFNHIVSGTFSGILYNYANTDSLRIAGGVFDVKTSTY